jgi:hypothetical protein
MLTAPTAYVHTFPVESTALSKTELAALVEGWAPRGREALKDLASNVGAIAGGDLAARTSPATVAAIGAVLQLGDALAGPRHPYLQMMLGKPGVGMVDAALAIGSYKRRLAKIAAQGGG